MATTFDLKSENGIAVGVAKGPLDLDTIKNFARFLWRTVEGPSARVVGDGVRRDRRRRTQRRERE